MQQANIKGVKIESENQKQKRKTGGIQNEKKNAYNTTTGPVANTIIQYLDTLAILVASAKFDASSDIVVIKSPVTGWQYTSDKAIRRKCWLFYSMEIKGHGMG